MLHVHFAKTEGCLVRRRADRALVALLVEAHCCVIEEWLAIAENLRSSASSLLETIASRGQKNP